MVDYTVSADAGNGGSNVVMAKANGLKTYYEPSVRAIATGESLGLEGFELQYEYVDWYGNRYITGDDVLQGMRRGVERHMGANRYGDEFHQFLVANALARMGVKKGDVDLTLFAPPGLYGTARQEIRDRFLENGGKVEIKLKSDKRSREWRYANVNVLPEGIGAAMCLMFDDDGNLEDPDVLNGSVVVLDIGAFTLDALQLRDGNFDPESLEFATMENEGVNTHVRRRLLRMLQKHDEDFSTLDVDDIDLLLRRGYTTGDFTVHVAGKELNVEKAVFNVAERYADWIANNVIDGVFNGLRGIKTMILVGGGAVMVGDKLMELYGPYDPTRPDKGGKILDARKHPTTKKIHPADMNAVGGLRYALMLQRQRAGE